MSDSQAKVSTIKESSPCVLNDTAQEIIPQIPLGVSPGVLTVRHLLTYIQHSEVKLYNVPCDR